MTDLEQRLRNDAARPDDFAPPSLDAALDAAVARRSPAGWLAAAAVLLVLAGVTVVMALQSGGRDRATPMTVPTISGVPLHRGDRTLRPIDDAGVDTVFRVPSDPRALDVLVPYSKLIGGCSLFRPRVTVVEQTSSQVRLRASGYSYVGDAEPANSSDAPSCNVDETRTVRIRLATSLGTRTVYGDAAGKAQVRLVTPADVLRPAYVPRGFQQTQVQRSSGTHGIATSAVIYTRDSGALLTIDAGDADDLPTLNGPVGGRTNVNGTTALIYERDGENCVSWVVQGGQARQVCASGPPLLAIDEVLKVARSLP